MKFFNRTSEIATLKEIQAISTENAQFTVVTGRRRIGKTALVLKAYEEIPFLYFFVARKPENELCLNFQDEIELKTGMKMMGKAQRFIELFENLMEMSKTVPLTLFIDEFQEFLQINPAIYSEMQRVWDLNHSNSKINLIVCGSVNSLITKIFTDLKEPLYNRQTRFMKVAAFKTSVVKEILEFYHPSYRPDDLLSLYAISGGVAKYVQLLVDNKKFTRNDIINFIFRSDSVFLPEGKSVLIEEFGKDYINYFAILSAIATGKTRRNEIEEVVGREIGGYLSRLENDYRFISKKQPLFEKTRNKNIIYTLNDCFFSFWFRFIYRYNYMLEIEAYNQIIEVVKRDFDIFSGHMLERYFYNKLIESGEYTRIGSWWDRKGENEIDLIAINELNQTATFFEVKRNADKISLPLLQRKVDVFMNATHELRGYTIAIKGLSMDDM